MRFSRVRALLTALLGAATATACVHVATTPLGAGRGLPPVPADSVRVFATQAPAAYTELALLRTERPLSLASDRRALRALRQQAGQLGANGVLLLNPRNAASTHGDVRGIILGRRTGVFSGQVDTEVDEVERAVAIRYAPADTARTAALPSGSATAPGRVPTTRRR